MLLCQVLTALFSFFAVRQALRRATEAEKHAAKCESVSVEASSCVLAFADQIESFAGEDHDAGVDLRPVVLGYGQTRSKGAAYIYRDIRDPDGTTRREFVQRIPFKK